MACKLVIALGNPAVPAGATAPSSPCQHFVHFILAPSDAAWQRTPPLPSKPSPSDHPEQAIRAGFRRLPPSSYVPDLANRRGMSRQSSSQRSNFRVVIRPIPETGECNISISGFSAWVPRPLPAFFARRIVGGGGAPNRNRRHTPPKTKRSCSSRSSASHRLVEGRRSLIMRTFGPEQDAYRIRPASRSSASAWGNPLWCIRLAASARRPFIGTRPTNRKTRLPLRVKIFSSLRPAPAIAAIGKRTLALLGAAVPAVISVARISPKRKP